MHYLIDGYNFLFCHPLFQELSHRHERSSRSTAKASHELQEKRAALIDYLGDLAHRSHFSLSLVFDSPKNASYLHHDRYLPIEVIYSPFGMSADEWILEALVHQSKQAPKCVVTNDKRLRNHINSAHLQSISIEEFLERAGKRLKREQKEKRPPISSRLIDHYTAIFESRYSEHYGKKP